MQQLQVQMKSLLLSGLILVLLLSRSEQAQRRQKASVQGTDCTQIKNNYPEATSGVYVIKPAGARTSFTVFCEMLPDGGWTVFQKRSGGEVSFNRNWASYESGFGNPAQDYWLGLNKVYILTRNRFTRWTLRVDLWDHEGGTAYAEYKNFRLGNEKSAYKLHVGKYGGNAGATVGSRPQQICSLVRTFKGQTPSIDEEE